MDVLEIIQDFRKQLQTQPPTEWWVWVEKVEVAISTDSHATPVEKQGVQLLRAAVINATENEGAPHTCMVTLALTTIQHSVERRTNVC